MQALNGIYIARRTDTGSRAVFVDEETIELAELSHKMEQNQKKQAAAAKAERDRQTAARRREQAEEQRLRRAWRRLVKQEVKLLAAGGVVALGWWLGLVELAFAVPVLLFCQTLICFRAGKYIGQKKEACR